MTALSLQNVTAFRTVWALNDLNKDRTLRATHYAICLQTGPSPIWGLFSVRTGLLQRLCWSRAEIERLHPHKSWKRLQQQWTAGTVCEPLSRDEQAARLNAQVRGKQDRPVTPAALPAEAAPPTCTEDLAMVDEPDLRVHHVRPPGIKCRDPDCPYNDNVYDPHRPDSFDGLCLNYIDDRSQAAGETEAEHLSKG